MSRSNKSNTHATPVTPIDSSLKVTESEQATASAAADLNVPDPDSETAERILTNKTNGRTHEHE